MKTEYSIIFMHVNKVTLLKYFSYVVHLMTQDDELYYIFTIYRKKVTVLNSMYSSFYALSQIYTFYLNNQLKSKESSLFDRTIRCYMHAVKCSSIVKDHAIESDK
jgi:hypothetical protein